MTTTVVPGFGENEMSNIPAGLRYVQSHGWIRPGAGDSATMGISDHAQEALGDVIFVELSELDKILIAGQEAGIVESVETASNICSPIGDEVVAINEALVDTPENVNSDPYAFRFFKLRPSSPVKLDELLGAADCQAAVDAGD